MNKTKNPVTKNNSTSKCNRDGTSALIQSSRSPPDSESLIKECENLSSKPVYVSGFDTIAASTTHGIQTATQSQHKGNSAETEDFKLT